ncbi:MAG: hypothetical protein ACE5I1_20540 [bacterium]
MPIKRVNFYKNQYLRFEDMQTEQGYHIAMRRRHNRKLHTSGVVEGLVIAKKNDTEITISEGMAIDMANDREGREIVLEAEQTITVSGDGERYITIAHKEEATDDPEEGFNVTGNDKIRVEESWVIAAVDKVSDIGGEQVILGVVVMEGGKIEDIHDGASPNHRRTSGAAGSLTIRDSKLDDPKDWVSVDLEAPGKMRIGGSLHIDDNFSLDFGSTTRQMLNLWSADTNHQYGIGVQANTQYYRSGNNFGWYIGGAHNNAQLNAGGGNVAMALKGPNGDLGIGTEAPEAKLHALGDGIFENAAPSLTVRRTDNNQPSQLHFRNSGGGYTANISVPGGTADLRIRVGDANNNPQALPERLTITKDGNVGIGTTAPEEKLHTEGDALINGKVRIGATYPPAGAQLNVGGSAFIEEAGEGLVISPGKNSVSLKYSDKKVFDPSPLTNLQLFKGKTIMDGKVGIGTLAPDSPLHLEAATSGTLLHLKRSGASPVNFWITGHNQYAKITSDRHIELRSGATGHNSGN